MPDTPVYAITYPCMGVTIAPNDFAVFTTDVEAALNTVRAAAQVAVSAPYAFAELTANPALGVEAVMALSGSVNHGLPVGAAAFTVVTGGLYAVNGKIDATQSTLTLTSQRLAVYVNGVFQAAAKWRGSNPADVSVRYGGFSVDLPLVLGDLVSFRYLWTGTGALLNPATGTASLTMLSTP